MPWYRCLDLCKDKSKVSSQQPEDNNHSAVGAPACKSPGHLLLLGSLLLLVLTLTQFLTSGLSWWVVNAAFEWAPPGVEQWPMGPKQVACSVAQARLGLLPLLLRVTGVGGAPLGDPSRPPLAAS